jgi:Flp pilus assembly protein TadG
MAAVRRTARLRDARGAELVEFALVLPLLLMVVLGIIDFGLLFQRYEVLTNAAREGARVAVLPGYLEADVDARVAQFLVAGGLTEAPETEFVAPAGVDVGGVCITMTGVTVTYPHDYVFLGAIMAFFGNNTFNARTLTATSVMRYEGGALACP